MTLISSLRALTALTALAFLPLPLSGCAFLEEEGDEPTEESAQSSPPEQVEVAPVIENRATQLWRPGYWAPGDSSGSFVWISGAIIPRPAPTASWAPARWVHHTYGWAFQEGHWQ